MSVMNPSIEKALFGNSPSVDFNTSDWLDASSPMTAFEREKWWLYTANLKPVADSLCKLFNLNLVAENHLPSIVVRDHKLDDGAASFTPLWSKLGAKNVSHPTIKIDPRAPFEAFIEEVGHFIHFHYLTINEPVNDNKTEWDPSHPFQDYYSNPLWSDSSKKFVPARERDWFDPEEEYKDFIMDLGLIGILETVGSISRHIYFRDDSTFIDRTPYASIEINHSGFLISIEGEKFEIEMPTRAKAEETLCVLELPKESPVQLIREDGYLSTLQLYDYLFRKFNSNLNQLVGELAPMFPYGERKSFALTVINAGLALNNSSSHLVGAAVSEHCARRLIKDPSSMGIFRDIAFIPRYGVEDWMKCFVDYGDGRE